MFWLYPLLQVNGTFDGVYNISWHNFCWEHKLHNYWLYSYLEKANLQNPRELMNPQQSEFGCLLLCWPWSNSTPYASRRAWTAATPTLLLLLSWSAALQFVLSARSGSVAFLIASNFLGEGLVPTPDSYGAIVSRQKCTKTLLTEALEENVLLACYPAIFIQCTNKDSSTINHLSSEKSEHLLSFSNCMKRHPQAAGWPFCSHSQNTASHSVHCAITPTEVQTAVTSPRKRALDPH